MKPKSKTINKDTKFSQIAKAEFKRLGIMFPTKVEMHPRCSILIHVDILVTNSTKLPIILNPCKCVTPQHQGTFRI